MPIAGGALGLGGGPCASGALTPCERRSSLRRAGLGFRPLRFDPLGLPSWKTLPQGRRQMARSSGTMGSSFDEAADGSPLESALPLEEPTLEFDETSLIEASGSVGDFADMQLDDINCQIETRRSRIFLLMEEVRRLKIQQTLKGGKKPRELEILDQRYDSAVPILQQTEGFIKEENVTRYYAIYLCIVLGIIVFGGLIAPTLEVRMGLGGQSYLEFISSMHLPEQLAEVDPIVASFCGGAVGVVSALLVVEINNIKSQQGNRCYYCQGTGYLTCGSCVGSGLKPDTGERCQGCAGTGKVMCTSCFCTGKHMVTEHDPRFDPFD